MVTKRYLAVMLIVISVTVPLGMGIGDKLYAQRHESSDNSTLPSIFAEGNVVHAVNGTYEATFKIMEIKSGWIKVQADHAQGESWVQISAIPVWNLTK